MSSATVDAHGGRVVRVSASSRIARAVVAVEDQRFCTHHGIDPHSLARVVWHAVALTSRGDPGGATISQQLAKRLSTGDRRDLAGKLEQVGLALKLERRYSKADILNMYPNVTYWGADHWGIWQASFGYFGKPPAGLLQAPSAYDPASHFALAQRRQRHVLDRLVATGVLSRAGRSGVFGPSRALAGAQTRPAPTATHDLVTRLGRHAQVELSSVLRAGPWAWGWGWAGGLLGRQRDPGSL